MKYTLGAESTGCWWYGIPCQKPSSFYKASTHCGGKLSINGAAHVSFFGRDAGFSLRKLSKTKCAAFSQGRKAVQKKISRAAKSRILLFSSFSLHFSLVARRLLSPSKARLLLHPRVNYQFRKSRRVARPRSMVPVAPSRERVPSQGDEIQAKSGRETTGEAEEAPDLDKHGWGFMYAPSASVDQLGCPEVPPRLYCDLSQLAC